MTPIQPTVLTQPVRYSSNCAALLDDLTRSGLITTAPGADGAPRPLDTVLLETVDITTGDSRTSIALLEAQTRLTCTASRVLLEALPRSGPDGLTCLQRVEDALGAYRTDGSAREGRLELDIPAPEASALEERERLRADSTIVPLRVLTQAKVDHPHLPLVAGVFAFDYLAGFEPLPEVGPGANTCPDYLFYDARILLVVDHPTSSATLVGASLDPSELETRMNELAAAIDAHSPTPAATAPPAEAEALHARPTSSDSAFARRVARLKESIMSGDVYQVVPSRGYEIDCPDALAAYGRLRESDPSPYMFYLGAPEFELFGASPESALLHSAASGRVTIRPIAGTRPRGFNAEGAIDHELDTRLELELRTDAKELAEHVMLVDLARNDLARVSLPGTRKVDQLLRVDRYSRVMHLVSEVSGILDPELDALDAFRASMTMGTLTGAPKLRAAELIRLAEGVRRGSYGGSVGYLRGDGEFDTCIVIRSAFAASGRALVQAGAGVVFDSDPDKEAAETAHKASAVLHAIAASQGRRLLVDSGDEDENSRKGE